MKTIIKKLLSLALIFCFIFSLSACGGDTAPTACSHNYVSTVTKQATCNETGLKTYTCSLCQKTYTEDIAKLNTHTYKSEITKEATCGKSGTKTFTCTICKHFYTEDIPSSGSHHFTSSITKQPTCKEKGIETYLCIICGETYDKYIDKISKHSYVCAITKNATSEDPGVKTYTCSICDDSYTESFLLSEVVCSKLPAFESLYNVNNRLSGSVWCHVESVEVSQENILTKVRLKIELSVYDSSLNSIIFSGGTNYFKLKIWYLNSYDQEITVATKTINLPRMTEPGIKYVDLNMSLSLPQGPKYIVEAI